MRQRQNFGKQNIVEGHTCKDEFSIYSGCWTSLLLCCSITLIWGRKREKITEFEFVLMLQK